MTIQLPITVVAFETDFGGVVSNTRYLEYIERGRYALLEAAEINIADTWDRHGAQPVVKQVKIEYLGFAQHQDKLVLEAHVRDHGRATTTISYELKRVLNGAVVMRAEQTLAYVNNRGKPVRVPQFFREEMPAEESDS